MVAIQIRHVAAAPHRTPARQTDPSPADIPVGGVTVQQAVRITGLSEHNLRFYERAGLLGHVPRDASSGHRRYSAANIRRFEMLACLRTIGMSLDEMRQYFAQATRGAEAAADQIALLETQGIALEEQIGRLQRTIENLDLKTEYWRALAAADEPRAAAIAHEFSARI